MANCIAGVQGVCNRTAVGFTCTHRPCRDSREGDSISERLVGERASTGCMWTPSVMGVLDSDTQSFRNGAFHMSRLLQQCRRSDVIARIESTSPTVASLAWYDARILVQ